ncbi:hypothetical protein JMI89_08325 [Frischella sp. Ac48]|uniref:hypothetical protein n=1 Tax=Frischella sp. Ac48 TaxID=2804531 RepID=UPI001C7DC67D|nr:hypothetical protein [Frischella sp. Ac48]MBX4133636.1 hypothetical protein [Frischella sp. Ac48]
MNNTEFLHLYIRNFLLNLENATDELLKCQNWLDFLIKKESVIGKKSISKLINDKGISQLITYSLTYTFFDDIEDNLGQRPNDVVIGFVLRLSYDKKVLITRDIVSELKDVEYPNIYFDSLTTKLKNEISNMSQSFQNILSFFLENSI